MENLPSALHEDEPRLPASASPVRAPAPPQGFPPMSVPLPTRKQQSYGALISIILIVLMIIVGAFYAWGKRIAEQQQYTGQIQHTLAQ